MWVFRLIFTRYETTSKIKKTTDIKDREYEDE